MKANIHPKYHPNVTVTCACGNSFVTGSTRETLRVEICGACHPFYTGKEKFVDTARRVEKFQEKMARVAATSGTRQGKRAKVAKKKAAKMAEQTAVEKDAQ
ncbi:MAG: 50S ribosomal protein L31 [Candidatus Magasanikbacteria bacterium GW2011_GWA2_56_11]|uniref:Large ribosomal subunit protein bL31 n=1 Tax=Candidatus Magasanikbacteria bacterium GW2011_GWA2_56_11 TaxID=1619044 RepID=A0A0G1YI66_9BACT|nr:MAG: 50S ribosomal protein L31 [Candidatus Magasanikbacteria bacterium GW2011_GWA2_56_11]